MKNKLAKVGTVLGLFLMNTSVAFAGASVNIDVPTPTHSVISVGELIGKTVGAAIIIAAILAFMYLVWGGIEWISSGGDKAGMESARNKITAAFVGLVIVVAAFAVMKLVGTFFGFDITNLSFPGLTVNP